MLTVRVADMRNGKNLPPSFQFHKTNIAFLPSYSQRPAKATDHEADLEVGEQDERDEEDADHGEGEVPPQLEHDDLVGLPRGVNLEEEAGEGGI